MSDLCVFLVFFSEVELKKKEKKCLSRNLNTLKGRRSGSSARRAVRLFTKLIKLPDNTMQTSKVVTMLAGVAALSSVAYAGEVMGAAQPTGGADFLAKGKDTLSVRFSGRTEFEYSTAGTNDGFNFRRVRLGAKAKLGSGFYSDTVLDFTNASNGNGAAGVVVDKAIIGYKVNDSLKVTAGRSKVVFGFEETSSSSKGVFLERSNLNDVLDGAVGYDRQANITFHADLGGGFSGAFSYVNDGSRISAAGNDDAYFTRLQWANDTFTVGGDYAHVGNNDAYTLYAQYSQGGLTALLEWFDAELAGADVDGFAARVSYRFDKWEPVIRYSDFSRGAGAADDNDELYVGLNYYVAPGVTLLTGYTDQTNLGADSNEFTSRLRLLW